MKNDQNTPVGFSYTYSAEEQAELKRIREKYTPPTEEEGKISRLRRLDASVTSTAGAVSLAFGVVGTLILGLGMSLCMTELGGNLGLSGVLSMALGIVAGGIGGVLSAFAYPIYNAIVRAKRKKLAPEILRLTDELMK